MDDLLAEFLTECGESMTLLDAELAELERNPDDPELIASIFRLVHTIKGTCGFLDLPRLETVTHAAETVLVQLRDREMVTTPAVIALVRKALDRIKDILDALANDPTELTGDNSDLVAALDALADQEPTKAGAAGRSDVASRGAGAEILAAQTLRVPVHLLERLTTLVDELVLTRNQLQRSARHNTDPTVKASLQQLNQITAELQAGVMKTRMQAIGTVWSKLPRLIRDLALELDKEIDLDMQGAETEVDRQVLEMIKDPLTHMVRNAADHGLEAPADRRRLGKPSRGTIGLTAWHEGGHIIIEIHDDGKGLDTRRIAERAVARGLVAAAEIDAMTEADIQKFILHPGVSTADRVTAVSGRGVGMDIVRTNIEKIGGSIEISSKAGKGAVFTIRIPLTFAIEQGRAGVAEAGKRPVHGWSAHFFQHLSCISRSLTRRIHAALTARRLEAGGR